jgi:hypothetical protein
MNDGIDAKTYSDKCTELRDQEARLRLKLEARTRGRDENADIAAKAFELSQKPSSNVAYG